ncbi:MAG: hypothetical protein EA402_13630, partial [Planctomycetota bacterium]
MTELFKDIVGLSRLLPRENALRYSGRLKAYLGQGIPASRWMLSAQKAPYSGHFCRPIRRSAIPGASFEPTCCVTQGGSKLTLGKESPLRGDAFSAKSALFRAFLLADQEIG